MINLTPVLQAVVSLCAALITAFLIPWIKEKAGKERTVRLLRITDVAVRAAEQMFNTNGEKLDYVLKYLKERGFEVSADELRATVEAAVYEMNKTVSNGIHA